MKMSRIRTFVFILIVVSISFSVIAPASAQEAPGEPANFWGEVSDEDGNDAPVNTTIVAVVDGEVEDEITVETTGQYGEEDALGDKLSLDSDTGDTVNFHLNDPNGESALQNPYDLDSGTYELDLEFPAGTFPTDGDNSDESSGDDSQSTGSDQDGSGNGGSQPIDTSDGSDETESSDDSSGVDNSDDIDSSENSSENERSDTTETTNEDTEETDDSTPGFGTPIVVISIVTLTLLFSNDIEEMLS